MICLFKHQVFASSVQLKFNFFFFSESIYLFLKVFSSIVNSAWNSSSKRYNVHEMMTAASLVI